MSNLANHEFRGYSAGATRGISIWMAGARDGGEKRGDCGKVKRKSLEAELPCSSVSIVLSARTAIRLISQDPPGISIRLSKGYRWRKRGATLVSFRTSENNSKFFR